MRNFLLFLLLISVLLAAHATRNIRSHLLVERGKQFVLGGDPMGSFRESAHNSGTVLFLERAPQGPAVARRLLEPCKWVQLRFGAGAAVLVRNLGRAQAVLDLDIKGPSGSRMESEPATTN